ncbi:MAG: hypothetical protein AAF600_08530 [Bacteroidota bacterium]
MNIHYGDETTPVTIKLSGDENSFLNSGFLGIGLTDPSHILHVKSTTGAVGLFESTQNQAYLRLHTNEGISKRVEFANRPGGRAAIWVSEAFDVFNILANGRVGIGTINPTNDLHVHSYDGGLKLSSSATNSHIWSTTENGSKWQDLEYRAKNHIFSQGNVGIGIANPTQKLQVAGTVYSTEVKVELEAGKGPDYVFESDYKLRTLSETKEFIIKNKHLPEIPSAKEMEVNGVDLGDMNMRLLKKIEELTLYQIELMEEMGTIKKELQALKD